MVVTLGGLEGTGQVNGHVVKRQLGRDGVDGVVPVLGHGPALAVWTCGAGAHAVVLQTGPCMAAMQDGLVHGLGPKVPCQVGTEEDVLPSLGGWDSDARSVCTERVERLGQLAGRDGQRGRRACAPLKHSIKLAHAKVNLSQVAGADPHAVEAAHGRRVEPA